MSFYYNAPGMPKRGKKQKSEKTPFSKSTIWFLVTGLSK